MSNLEREIEEYIVSNNIEQMTAKQLADKFFVSRTYLYKVLKQMGYSSYTDLKFEKKMRMQKSNELKAEEPCFNDSEIRQMNSDLFKAKIIYIVGVDSTSIIAEYVARQLLNLDQLVILIRDLNNLNMYTPKITPKDVVMLFSNTGNNLDIYKILDQNKLNFYVITKQDSVLYKKSEYKVGFVNEVDKLSNKFDQEDITALLMLTMILLTKFKNHLVTHEITGDSLQ